MRYVDIPRTDLRVAGLCLGTSHLGTAVDRTASFALLDVYYEAGGTFLDTAAVYADWMSEERSVSEKTIGAWLAARRLYGQVVVGTKGAHPDLRTMHIPRLSPKEILGDLERSLRHLGTDRIDLYYLHRDDPGRPVEEIMDTLHGAWRAGHVRYVGCSNWRAERLRQAQAYATREGWPGFVANQALWNAAALNPEARADKTTVPMDADLLAYHRQTGMAAVAYSSQAGGLFQKMAEGRLPAPRPGRPELYPRGENARRLERIRRIGAEAGLSITQVTLGYLAGHPFPAIPIVGCKTLPHLRDSLTAADTVLSAEQVAYVEGREP